MPYDVRQKLILIAVFSNAFTPGNVQIAVPMYMPAVVPQPVFAVPAPMPVAVAIELPERTITQTTTTTTTTEPPQYGIAIPVPVPMPMPVQFAIPAQPPPVFCQGKPKPKTCPPCPPCVCLPSCTPAFFSYCSPCHQRCRCRNSENAPVPLPPNPPIPDNGPVYPMPLVPAPVVPPHVVVVPMPPIIQKPYVISSSDSSDTSDSCDRSSNSYYLKSGRKLRKTINRRKQKYRRNVGDDNEENTDLVKPILSYVSENGDVKFETKLSNKDAIKILNEEKIKTSNEEPTVNTEAHDGSVLVTNGRKKSGRRYNKVRLRNGSTNRELKKGKNKIIFKPPPNKKINNVAVSFQVT